LKTAGGWLMTVMSGPLGLASSIAALILTPFALSSIEKDKILSPILDIITKKINSCTLSSQFANSLLTNQLLKSSSLACSPL
jgi:hypothetical protein